jgi:hypothetical protein
MASEFRGIEALRPPRRKSAPKTPASTGPEKRRPGTLLGVLALLAAIVTGVLVWVGISWAMDDRFGPATSLAYVATGTSVAAVLGGICALVLDRGRGWGLAAIAIGLVANPLVLTRILGWASGLG